MRRDEKSTGFRARAAGRERHGARLPGLTGLFFPRVRCNDEVAKAIVEYALKRGRFAPIRPRMVKTTLVLGGLLTSGGFFRATRLFGLHRSMDTWVGAQKGKR
jgi:hypothetical protein